MTWFRKYPLFATGLVVCALLALGELLFLYERFSTSRDAEKRLQQRKAELAGMEQLTPPPTRAVASAIEADPHGPWARPAYLLLEEFGFIRDVPLARVDAGVTSRLLDMAALQKLSAPPAP